MFKFLNINESILRSPDDEGAGGSGGAGTGGSEGDNTDDKGGNGAGDGDGGSGGGDKGDKPKLLTPEEAQALIDAEVARLKNKNSELLGEIRDLKKKPTLSDDEYAQYRQIQERIQRDELLKLMSEGKSEEALDIATRRVKADYEARIQAEAEEKNRVLREAEDARNALAQTKISIEVTREASTRVEQEYQPLLETIINRQLKLVDGAVRVVDDSGEVRMNGKGKPMSVGELIDSIRPTYPALFKPSAGGGAGGSSGKTPANGNGQISHDAVADMSMEEYLKARKAGQIS